MKHFIYLILTLLFAAAVAEAGGPFVPRDSATAISALAPGALSSPMLSRELPHPEHTWGVNILMSTNGFGMGTFYKKEFSDEYSGFVDFSISEAKDDQAIDYTDPYTGLTYTPGEVNRFLVLPLMFGIEKRMFKDDIIDNFRPFLTAGVGPSMVYVFSDSNDFFTDLGHGQAKYTFGGFIGGGAYFGAPGSNVMGLNVRYYFIPYPHGLPSFDTNGVITNKSQFGGFFISFTFGTAW
ncbi:MAG TPA: hypothetical protein VKS81_03885 [Bacteroidota bacterium]|nr:hypothetical protein [Bacteroidota bacterium]